MRNIKDLFIASLLGGAIGDALGYTVEFMTLDKIKSKFGEHGITGLKSDKVTGRALISDDTQMTLFTADGMIWAYQRCSERGIGSFAGSGIINPTFVGTIHRLEKRRLMMISFGWNHSHMKKEIVF